METAVRKATRLEYRPPKEKHLLTLKNLTFENPANIDGILVNLEKRLKERSWIITYKVLVIIHYLMREGNCVRVIDAVIKRPSVLDASRIKNKSHTPANVQNIYLYRAYLDERVIAFRHLKRDYVAESLSKEEGRLRHLFVKDGLLKETAALQRQMESVLKCKFYLDEKDPQITWFAYRMVIEDLLALFKAVNEGVVNILEHYFEMNKSDATTALNIYKTFAQQTELTITYLNEARKLENNLQMSIPPIKHAPLLLATALEEYLNDGSADQVSKNQPKHVSRNNTIQKSQPVNQQALQQSFQQQQQQSMQQPLQQSMQQTVKQQQQPFMQQQPIQQSYNQSQIQNDPFNAQQTDMDIAFSTLNRQSTFSPPQRIIASPQASSLPVQNPFLNTINQSSISQLPINTSSSSPFATINTQGYASSSSVAYSPNGSATFSSAAVGQSNNPFRSMGISSPHVNSNLTSINFNSLPQQHQQQIAVAKPSPYQLQPQSTGLSSNNNPFSPATPPLTPNPPLRSFTNPQPSNQFSAPNPFITQQQNVFNTTNANYQNSSAF